MTGLSHAVTLRGVTYPPGPANPGYTPHHTPPVPLPDTSTGWYLNQPAPPPPPPKRWSGLKITLVVLAICSPLLLLALIASAIESRQPAPSPAAEATTPGPDTDGMGQPAGAAPTAGDNDAAGKRACEAIQAANAGADNVFQPDPAAMLAIAQDGMSSTNEQVKIAATFLSRAAERARAAKGASDEATQGIKLGTAALELETECLLARYIRPR